MRCGLCSMAWRMAYCYGARTSGRSPWGAPRVADRLATELFFLVPFFLNQGVPTLVSVTVLGLGGVLVLSYAGDNFTPTRVTRPPSYSIGPSARTTPPNSHVRCATRRAPPASWVFSRFLSYTRNSLGPLSPYFRRSFTRSSRDTVTSFAGTATSDISSLRTTRDW